MTSIEEIKEQRQLVISTMHAFYASLANEDNPINLIKRMQGKINDLIDYIILLEKYIALEEE